MSDVSRTFKRQAGRIGIPVKRPPLSASQVHEPIKSLNPTMDRLRESELPVVSSRVSETLLSSDASTSCNRDTTRHSLRLHPVSSSIWHAWKSLESQLHSPYLLCSEAWTRLWVETYGGIVPHQVAIMTRGDQNIGMSLVTEGVEQFEGPWRIRTRHLGTAGEPDGDSVCVQYNRLLVSDADRSLFSNYLLTEINRQTDWEALRLDGLSDRDAQSFLTCCPNAEVQEKKSYFCALDKIRQAPNEPWRLFGDSTRNNLRRNLRDLGELTVDWSETIDQAIEFYAQLIQFHQARWNAVGKPGAFASRYFIYFHRALIVQLLPSGRAALVRIRQGERVLGILYLLIDNNRLLFYQAGLPERAQKLCLGTVTQYLTQVEGARRGYDAFDFLAGEARYKKSLATDSNSLFWLQVRRPNVKSYIVNAVRALKDRLSR